MDFTLDTVTSARKKSAYKVVLYGVEGIGKTLCASLFPNPIFLRTEDGAGQLDVPTFPMVKDLKQFGQAIQALKGDHDYKTLVIDSLDWFEPLVYGYTCQKFKKETIESFGYGKGYVEAEAVWRGVVAQLDSLAAAKDMNIVWCAHSSVTKYDPPDSDPYMRYNLKIHERGAAVIREWADFVLFMNYQVNVRGTFDAGSKAKAMGDGDRVIYTAERPAFHAKHRLDIPDMIEIGRDKTYKALFDALFQENK